MGVFPLNWPYVADRIMSVFAGISLTRSNREPLFVVHATVG